MLILKRNKNLIISLLIIAGLFLLFNYTSGPKGTEEEVINNENNMQTEEITNPLVTLRTSMGDIVIELYMDKMPITAANFLKLANEGYYTGTKFHRVIDNFMIQGGDPNSKGDDTSIYGIGGPGYAIEDEFVEGLSNVRGTLSMANAGPNTGGSQFFINYRDNTNLDFDKEPLLSKHPVFGHVSEGMDIVDAIIKVETGARDIPVEPIVINEVLVK